MHPGPALPHQSLSDRRHHTQPLAGSRARPHVEVGEVGQLRREPAQGRAGVVPRLRRRSPLADLGGPARASRRSLRVENGGRSVRLCGAGAGFTRRRPRDRPTRGWTMKASSRARLGVVALSVVSVAIGAALFLNWFENAREHRITIAAGAPSGESHLLSEALKAVVERHYPNIKVTVRQTGGSAESLQLLEQGKVAMAAAQADVPVGPTARWVAVLYQ